MNNEPVAWNYNDKNLHPTTITFHNVNSDWVMKITADRKIIVNEDVEVSKAAQAVLDAMKPLLVKSHPVKELTDEEIRHIQAQCHLKDVGYDGFIMRFARAILRKAQE